MSTVIFTEGSAPAIPPANKVSVYAKNDSLVYQMDDTGTERPLGVGDGVITPDELSTSVAGAGLIGGGGSPLDVNVDNVTLQIASDILKVKPRTRQLWIPVNAVYDENSFATIYASVSATGIGLPDAIDGTALGSFKVPSNYSSGNTLKVIGGGSGSGNVYIYLIVSYGAVGEAMTQHSQDVGPAAVAVTTTRSELRSMSVTNLAAGDVVFIKFVRYATNVLDTLNGGTLTIDGFYLEYTADS